MTDGRSALVDAVASLSQAPPGTLDEGIIAELLHLDRVVRPGVLRRLTQTFADTSAALIERIARGDDAAAAAHSLKGASASIGAVCLVELVVELQEFIARGAADAAIARLLDAIRGEREAVGHALARVTGNTPPPMA
jgi:HPt (histidine-containing phosphotransfer) domain-containing protein